MWVAKASPGGVQRVSRSCAAVAVERGGMVGIAELVGSRLIKRDGARTGGRVWRIARVQRLRLESPVIAVLVRHLSSFSWCSKKVGCATCMLDLCF